MAHKRMFSKDITGSDAFLEMPASSQALYFHFGMEADDDGFIGNPKKIMRVMGVSEDDMKILLAKRFLLAFKSGIIVVKHHRINNNWDAHNCKRTIYLEEFSELRIKENRAYTLDETQGVPVQSDSRLNPVFRIDKNRIDKNTTGAVAIAPRIEYVVEDEDRPAKKESRVKDKLAIYHLFSQKEQPWWRHAQQKKAALSLFDLVGADKVRAGLQKMRENVDDPYCPQAQTPFDYEVKLPKLSAYAKRNS
jgi:hypothetical protein